jgi:hypothetical protein
MDELMDDWSLLGGGGGGNSVESGHCAGVDSVFVSLLWSECLVLEVVDVLEFSLE